MTGSTLVLAMGLAAAGSAEGEGKAIAPAAAGRPAVVLVDDVGREVTLPAPPGRIVSTAPSSTALLFALGVGPRLVGVTTYCVDPEEARRVAKVGDFQSLDFERVLELRPDLVVATWLEQRRQVERLEQLGLRVLVLYPSSLDETMRSILTLGRAVGAETRAAELVADMRRRLDVVDRAVGGLAAGDRPRVFVELGSSPLYTAGPGSTVAEAVERAGGRNIAHDLGKPWSTIARETVVARDPEVVLVGMTSVGPDAAAAVAAEPGFDRLSAVRTGRVYAIDPAVLFQHNHRLVDGIELLHRLFHPER